MFFIWGFGTRQKVFKYLVDANCGHCGAHCHMNLIKRYGCGTIFFIPVVKANTKYFLLCPSCGTLKQISKKEFKELDNQFRTSGQPTVYYKSNTQSLSGGFSNTASGFNTINSLKEEAEAPSMHTLITQDIEKQMEKIREKNYKLTPQNVERLKPALKQLLLKKYENEFIVDASLNDYFNHLKY